MATTHDSLADFRIAPFVSRSLDIMSQATPPISKSEDLASSKIDARVTAVANSAVDSFQGNNG